jgi:hypothetical protein
MEALRRELEERTAALDAAKAELEAKLASQATDFREQLAAGERKFRDEFEALLASADELAASLDKVTRERDESAKAVKAEAAAACAAAESSAALCARAEMEARRWKAVTELILPRVRAGIVSCQRLERSEANRQKKWAENVVLAGQPAPTVPSNVAYADVEQAFELLQSEGAMKQFTYSLGACSDAGPIDHAVTDLLNSLGLPFFVPIRRLGPGGDYFIDRRLNVRLVGGQVMVRCRSQQPSSSFESLAKYLLHLYAPMLVDDDTVEPLPPAETSANSEEIAALQHQQHQLKQSLAMQQQLLRQHHRELLAELSPSPEREQIRQAHTAAKAPPPDQHVVGAPVLSGPRNPLSGWRRPPSPSPEASRASESPEATPHAGRPSPAAASAQQQQTSSAPAAPSQVLQQRQRQLLSDSGILLLPSGEPGQPVSRQRGAAASAVSAERENVAPAKAKGGLLPKRAAEGALDLSQLTTDELEKLKKAALAQQIREMRQSSNRGHR